MRKEALVLLGILTFVALALRGGHVWSAFVDKPLRADAGEYVFTALNLAEHGVLSRDRGPDPPRPDAWRSPGYPLFLAAVESLAGSDRWLRAALYVQAVLGTLLVPLVFLLALALLLPAWAALTAAALTAIEPHLAAMTGNYLTETLFSVLLAAALLLVLRRRLVLGGLLLGTAYLVNETALLLAGGLGLALLFSLERGARLRAAASLLVPFALFPAVWQARNATLPAGAPTGGRRALLTLVHGSYPGFVFRTEEKKYYPYQEDPEYPAWGESVAKFAEVFARRFRERPGRYLAWYLLEKPFHAWRWGYLQGSTDIFVYPTRDSPWQRYPPVDATRWLSMALYPLLLALAILALPLCLLRGKPRPPFPGPVLLLSSLGVYTLVGMVFAPWPRYVVPLKPVLFVTALWTVATLSGHRGARASEEPQGSSEEP